MAALTADRNAPKRPGDLFDYPVAASKKIYTNAMVVLDSSGNAEPATTATGKKAVGRATALADNSTGTAAAITVSIEAGVFLWANGDSITKTSIGSTAYAVDDQTVAKTATGKSAVGIIVDVDSTGVWVDTRPETSLGSTGLLAASNLGDVASAASSRSNLGLDTGDSPTFTNVTASGKFIGVKDNIRTDKISISLSEMKALAAAPKTLVAAQGANTVIEFVSLAMKLNYGSAAFVESSDNLQVAYVNAAGKAVSPVYETTASFLVATADAIGILTAAEQFLTASAAQAVNVPIVLFNTSGDFTGGTGSTVDVWVTYRVHDVS